MKILLISSNLLSQFPRCFPNATACLSAFLKRENFDVKMVHLHSKWDMKKLPKAITSYQPDIVGCSTMTCEAPLVFEITKMVKDWKNVPVLCGGIHAVIDPESLINLPTVDAVCIGEGEMALLEYLQKYQEGKDVTDTPSFWFKRNGDIIKNPTRPFIKDLDSLPYPDRTQGDQQKVIQANNGTLNLLLGRGCNWTCRFCCNRDIAKANDGVYVRNRSVASAIGELKILAKKFTFDTITIRDDNFPWDKDWALEFCKEYPKHLDQQFEIFARVDCLDKEIIDALKAAGCYSIFIGLDSGNDFIRNEVLHKKQNNQDLMDICHYMKSVDLQPVISNIVGLPFETPKMHRDTVQINKELYKDKVFFSPSFGATPKIWVFDPWPGTELFRVCKEEGWMKSDQRIHKVYRQSSLNMPQFSPKQIDRLYRRFRYDVYKESFPFHAWLFRIYDTRLVEEIMELIPLDFIGAVRETILKIMNKTVRKYLNNRKSSKGIKNLQAES